MSNIVRRITVSKVFFETLPSGQVIERSMVYSVNNNHIFTIDGVRYDKKIHEIIENETHLLIYVESENEVQLWKKIPKNDTVTIEYLID